MKKTFLFSLIIILCIGFTSCNGEKSVDESKTVDAVNENADQLKDEKLSGFMLAGIYFVEGYGGQATVDGMIKTDDQKEIVSNYKELLELPFKPEDGTAGPKNTLKSMWDVNDKAELIKTLQELKSGDVKKSTHRAWDYARLVNNACMGYAAGYLTAAEAEQFVAEVLPLAKHDFKNWDDYYADFNAGRKSWGGDPDGDQKFEVASKEILKSDKSIYKLLPLN